MFVHSVQSSCSCVIVEREDESDTGSCEPIWRIAQLSEDAAITLLAACSEDPASWSDLLLLVPRYDTPLVSEELSDHLEFTVIKPLSREQLDELGSWMVLDLSRKRVVSSPEMWLDGHDHVFDLFEDSNFDKRWPLSIHLPPCWEILDSSFVDQMDRPRRTASFPSVNRRVLYGTSLLAFLAERMMQFASTEEWWLAYKDDKLLYRQTLEIHRDWLMTPREDLQGMHPRQLLHGAHDWLERVLYAQQLRGMEGLPMIAVPTNVQNFATAPMAREEVVIYFELCRELIECGWLWLGEQRSSGRSQELDSLETRDRLIRFLSQAMKQWLKSPFEGNAAPEFIVECSRRRAPRSPQIPIMGMNQQQPVPDHSNCDCPICKMIEDGTLGPIFECLDGYQLELDQEFAFSLYETREQWQEEMFQMVVFEEEDLSADPSLNQHEV